MSDNFWQRRFDGDSSLLGRTVGVNGQAFTIIGMTPHDFMGTNINVPDFWIPMRLRPLLTADARILSDRERNCCALYGRLATGVSLEQAQAQMIVLANDISTLHAPESEERKQLTITSTPGSHTRPLNFGSDPGLVIALLMITGAVGLVLLIVCADVAGLRLAPRPLADMRSLPLVTLPTTTSPGLRIALAG